MTAPFLVTGGTGTLGRLVVPLLRSSGADVRVLSRRARSPEDGVTYVVGDLATGAGVAAATEGVGTVLHLAGSAKGDEEKARTLVAAASGVRHLVFISVVGADRVPVVSAIDRAMFGYYASQRAAERVVEGSGVPWTTLRATQFHDLILMVARGLARLPVCPVPSGLRAQPIDAGEVAARLVSLALGEPAGLVPDLAGPEVHSLDDLVRSYLHTVGKRRPILPVRIPGQAFQALRAGANLAPDHATGHITWTDFLATRLPTPH
ncbi:MAG TPA: SDR family oxidoreductase [Mycobacteriales bacterium]